MSIVLYDTVEKFMIDNKEKMLEREEVNQLILKNAMMYIKDNCTDDRIFGICIDEYSNPQLIFCICQPYNLIVNSYKAKTDEEAVKELALYLADNKIPFSGINANEQICKCFIGSYKKIRPVSFYKYLSMDIMKLTQLKNVELTKGKTRKAVLTDIELVAEWEVEFAKEAINEKVLLEERLERVRDKINQGIVYLFENDEGKVVSVVDAVRQLENGIAFSEVYTPLKERGKGYALTNMYYVSKLYLEAGNKFCTL